MTEGKEPTVADLSAHLFVVHERIIDMQTAVAELQARIAGLENASDHGGQDTDDLAGRVSRCEQGHSLLQDDFHRLATIVRNVTGGEPKRRRTRSFPRIEPGAPAATEKQEAELALLKATMLAMGVTEVTISESAWEEAESYDAEGQPGFDDNSVIRLIPRDQKDA